MPIKASLKEMATAGVKGVVEGVGKDTAEKGSKKVGETVEKASTTIKTILFGLGPEDEASFAIAFHNLKIKDDPTGEKLAKILAGLVNFMNDALDASERAWFRRVIDAMEQKKKGEGTKALFRLALIAPDHKAMKKYARTLGVVKYGPLEEGRDTLIEIMRRKIKETERKKQAAREQKAIKKEQKAMRKQAARERKARRE